LAFEADALCRLLRKPRASGDELCSFVQRVEKSAFFQLFDDRQIDELFRFRQRLLAGVLILDIN